MALLCRAELFNGKLLVIYAPRSPPTRVVWGLVSNETKLIFGPFHSGPEANQDASHYAHYRCYGVQHR